MSSEWKYGNWIAASWDKLHGSRHTLLGIDQWIFRERSRFQEVVIAHVPDRGRGLFLDALVQFLQVDEFVYHEALALPPLLYHQDPKRVLIAGGGDGLALREVLRDPRVREAVLVELDELVVEACRTHLEELHCGSFDDPRTKILIQDALPYLENPAAPFDVILLDLMDEYDEASLDLIRTGLGLAKKSLAPGGIVGTFGEIAHPHLPVRPVYQEIRRHFRHVALHCATIETFAGSYGFLLASDEIDFPRVPTDDLRCRAATLEGETRSLLPGTFPSCFEIPPFLRTALEQPSPPPKRPGDAFVWMEKP